MQAIPYLSAGPDPAATPMERLFQSAAVGTLCAATVAAPLALGASGACTRLCLEAAMAAAALVWCLTRRQENLAMLVVPTVACLGVIQCVPLSEWMLGMLSPTAAAAWKVAQLETTRAWGSLSVDPNASLAGVARLALALATIIVVAQACRDAVYLRAVVAAGAIAGGVIWALGALFPVTAEERILLGFVDIKGPIDYWLTPLEPPVRTCGVGERIVIQAGAIRYQLDEGRAGDGFGPFIYSNHFAGALCLTVPALLAGLGMLLRGRIPAVAISAMSVAVAFGALWTSGGVVRSRAGAACLALGVLLYFFLTARRRWSRRATMAAVVGWATTLAGFMLVFFGMLGGLADILPGFLKPTVAAALADPRIADTALAVRMFRASPLCGVGLDAYGQVSAKVTPGRFISFYAHNDYAQFLAETGAVGMIVAAALCWPLLKRLWSVVRRTPSPDSDERAAGWAALAAIAAHSAFDWNLHLPANGFLACVAVGLSMSQPLQDGGGTKPVPGRRSSAAPTAMRFAFGIVCLLALLVLARDSVAERSQRRLREAITAARILSREAKQPRADETLGPAIAAGERTMRWGLGNASLAMLLGQANAHAAAACRGEEPARSLRQASRTWFARARASGAMCPGMPESKASR